MEFEFDRQLIAQNLIDIPQIGSFAIEAESDLGANHYIVVRTSLGFSYIATCGPVVPGIEELPIGFTTNLSKIEYNEKKLAKIITLFLNDRSRGIIHAKLIDFDAALDEFRDLGLYMKEKFKEV